MLAVQSKRFIQDFFKSINGLPKTDSLINKFVTDKELLSYFKFYEKAFPKFEILPRDIIWEDDIIAVLGKFKGVQRGPLENLPPTNKTVQVPVTFFYKIKDDKIVKHKMIFDRWMMMEQLGALPKFSKN